MVRMDDGAVCAEWMGAQLTHPALARHSSAPALAAVDKVPWPVALRQYGVEWVEDLVDAATGATVDGMLPLVRRPTLSPASS